MLQNELDDSIHTEISARVTYPCPTEEAKSAIRSTVASC
jgi:hypothetical protein